MGAAPGTNFKKPGTKKLVQAAISGRPRPENLWIVYDYYNAKAMGEGLLDMIDAMPLVKHLHYSTDLGNNDRGYPGPQELEEVTMFLKTAADNGYHCAIVFVIQMNGIHHVDPNDATQPEFREALVCAVNAGVRVICQSCQVEADRIWISGTIDDTDRFRG